MVTRFIVSDGSIFYPNFLSDEERQVLRDRMEREKLRMRCSCRDDVMLLYGISADLRIYPLHNDYEHSSWCSRNRNDERTSPFVYEEDGKSTVYLKFDPRVYTPAYTKNESERIEDAADYINEYDDNTIALPESGPGKKREILPRCDLRGLITTINHDTYAERIMNGKNGALSEDYFKTAMLARCKKVYPSGMNKSLRALSLEEDRVCFIYGKVASCEESAVFIYGSEGKSYRRFVPGDVMGRADRAFTNAYGMSVSACLEEGLSVYVSGFAYKKISRSGNVYICFGRLCFFLVTRNGLIAGNMLELDVLEKLFSFARTCGGVFLFPDSENAEHFGVFRIPKQKKEGRIYLKKAPLKPSGAVLCVSEVPSDEQLQKFIEDICF